MREIGRKERERRKKEEIIGTHKKEKEKKERRSLDIHSYFVLTVATLGK